MDEHENRKKARREEELLDETRTEIFGLDGADAAAPETSPELQLPAPEPEPPTNADETVELGQETDSLSAPLDETATDLTPLDDAPEDPDLHLVREIEIVEEPWAEPDPDQTDAELLELAEPEPQTFHDLETDPEPDTMVPVAPLSPPIEPVGGVLM